MKERDREMKKKQNKTGQQKLCGTVPIQEELHYYEAQCVED
jgi:hypothetical protein